MTAISCGDLVEKVPEHCTCMLKRNLAIHCDLKYGHIGQQIAYLFCEEFTCTSIFFNLHSYYLLMGRRRHSIIP